MNVAVEEIMARLELVAVEAGRRSAEIESARALPTDLVDALIDTGVFRLTVPVGLGGVDAGPAAVARAARSLAYHDGSTGWVVMSALVAGAGAAALPRHHAATVLGEPRTIVVGHGQAGGVGRLTDDGGLMVNGRWSWGSGVATATWVGAGVRIEGAESTDAPADPRVVQCLFRRDQVVALDTWHAVGLRGTGSTDFQVTEAFVPEGRWVQIGVDQPERDNPFGRFSFYGLLALGIAATASGVARRAVDELVVLAETKRPQGSSRPLRDRATVQGDVAMAEAKIRSAWGFVADTVGAAWEAAIDGRDLTDEDRRLLRLAATHATQTASEVTELAYKAAGGAAVYKTSPIQRCLRDSMVATQHAMVAPRTFELPGRMRLGLETDTRQL